MIRRPPRSTLFPTRRSSDLTEIDYLKGLGVDVTPERLLISDRAQVIMPYHKLLDGAKEKWRGKNDIGTTGKGIGPCYTRSEEHTSELQSRQYLVCRLLLEKKKKQKMTY